MNRLVFFLLIVSAGIIGCRSQRELPTRTATASSVADVVKKMEQAMPTYDWAVLRFSAEYTGLDKNTVGLGGQLRIRNDSAIWVSLSPGLGLEAARVLISHDSLWFINRLKANYFVGDAVMLNKILMTNLDFDVLEALLLGNDFAFYDDSVFNLDATGKQLHLSTPNRRKLARHYGQVTENSTILIQDMWLDPTTYRIVRQQVKVLGQENQKLEVEYSDFREVEGKLIPHNLNLKISVDGDILVKIFITRVNFGIPQSMPFNIPPTYKPIQ